MQKTKRHFSLPLLAILGSGFLIIALIAFSILSIVQFQSDLAKTLTDMTKQNLTRYTEQSVVLFENMIEDYFLQLETIAEFCNVNTGSNDPAIDRLLAEHNSINPYIQYGVSGTDGAFYTGNREIRHIAGQGYFQEVLEGRRVVSDVLTTEDGRDLVVLAVPIQSNHQITGVAAAEYDVRYFTDLLGESQFSGFGATMVMQYDGKMVSSYAGMERFDTLYEALDTQMEFRDTDTLEHLKETVSAGESGFFTYYRDGKARYLYFQPTGIKDFTMLSLVLAESMDRDAQVISGYSIQFAIKNVVCYSLILLLVWAMIFFLRGMLHHAQIDTLTGVYNKAGLQALVERQIRNSRKSKCHALLFLDIDNFKTVNDTFGHKAGDQLLSLFAKVIRENIRSNDIVGRFGGDEFVLLLQDLPSPEVALYKARGLSVLLKNICGYPVSASIGIACFPRDGHSYALLAQHADEALYQAKESGKDRCVLYRQDDGERYL